jgi:hypothetical protein
MKVSEILLEYKNKYYKPVPKKPKTRAKKTLWYDNYDHWVTDIKTRFPEARAYYDEENEEVVAACEKCKDAYGKWSKRKDKFPGVSFHKPRNLLNVTKYAKNLKQVNDPPKSKPF